MGIFSKIFGSTPDNASPTGNRNIQKPSNNIKVKGTRSYGDGTKYVGEFINGVENGQGKQTYPDGRVYEGEWKANMYHGQGAYTLADGTKQTGEFKDGEFVG